jgi:hypothetical protein
MDSSSQRQPGVAQSTFAIVLCRLPAVNDRPGLISFLVDSAGGGKSGPATLTDSALRGRLAHFDAHSANEIAAVRKALSADNGSAVVYESWPALDSCLRFWYGFVGSQIRPIESACEACGTVDRGSVGGAVGESFLRLCGCGEVSRITVPNLLPLPGALAR